MVLCLHGDPLHGMTNLWQLCKVSKILFNPFMNRHQTDRQTDDVTEKETDWWTDRVNPIYSSSMYQNIKFQGNINDTSLWRHAHFLFFFLFSVYFSLLFFRCILSSKLYWLFQPMEISNCKSKKTRSSLKRIMSKY